MDKQKFAHLRKHWLVYLLLVLLLGSTSTLILNKKYALKQQATNFAQHQNTERTIAQHTLDSLTADQLTATMKALVWAIRSELVRENVEQVDQYFRQFVKTKGINEITLIENNGAIRLSTNMKEEGELLEANLAKEALAANDVLILNTEEENKIFLIAPVLSFNNRLGTLIVLYQKPQITYPPEG